MLTSDEVMINEITKPESINETTPLLETSVQQDGRFIAICNIIGSTTTFMAMVPQGIMGALLADKILLQFHKDFNSKNVPLLIVRLGIDGFIFITTEEGKRRLVRFFNTETFKNFGRGQWWKDNFTTRWKAIDIFSLLLNASFTIVASGVFAGLAAISFDGIAELLNDYQSHTTDEMSQWVKSYYIKAPFMLATFISNLPFFPSVHKNAFNFLRNAGLFLRTNPNFAHLKQIITNDIRAAQRLWKQANEENNEVAKQEFLTAYYAIDKGSLAKKLMGIGQKVDKKIKPETWFEFFVKHGIATILTTIGIIGLYNFLDMTDKTAALFHVEKAAPLLRWMDYSSMSAVVLSVVYPMAVTFIATICFDRNYNVNMISSFSFFWILLSAFIVCILGGAPNAYQSILAQENLAMIIIASIDSLLMESYGYYQIAKINKNVALSKNDTNVKQAYEIDAEIEKTIRHVENVASREEISELGGITTVIPPYRSSYNSVKYGIKHCLFHASQKSNLDTIISESDDDAIAVKSRDI